MRLGTIAFLAGVMIGLQFTHLPPLVWSILLFPLLLVLLRFPHLRMLTLLLCGVFWVSLRASFILDGSLATELEGKDAIIEGSIISIPARREDSSRFIFTVETMHVDGVKIDGPKRLRLSWYGKASKAVSSGQRWRLTARLKRPYGSMNPGGFDYERWLFQHRINATGYVRNDPENTRLAEMGYRQSFHRLRQHVLDRIGDLMGESNQLGIIQALALGERSQISPAQWQRLTDTGTSHLVAISGLHIGLVAAWVFFIVRWLWPRSLARFFSVPALTMAAILAWSAAFFYAAMAGFSIPTQRALVMVSVVMLGIIWQRPLALSYVWTLSLLSVLIYDPFAPLSAGFWLSYAAVAVIVFALGGRLSTNSLWWRFGRVHIVVALGLAPLLILLFQKVPWLSPLANFIAVPLVSLVTVPLTLLALPFVDLLPRLSEWLLLGAHYSLLLLDKVLTAIYAYSTLPVALPVLSGFSLISLVAGTLWLLMPRGWPARWLGLVGFLPVFVFSHERPNSNTFWLTVLDVGQGTAVVVVTKNHTLVYDTGARFSDRFDMGAAVVLPYLHQQGTTAVDTLVVSHADNDHIGGAPSIQEGIVVKQVLSSATERFDAGVASECEAGYSWQWDGVHFELLHPATEYVANSKRRIKNNRSCVLRISNGVETVLLPGDIEKHAERYLLQHFGAKLKANIIIAPHHGSRTSSSKRFVKRIDAEYVIYTVGYRNRYGFPKLQVMQRYQDTGTQAYRTDESGALRFVLDGDGEIAPPSQYRLSQQRFWNTVR